MMDNDAVQQGVQALAYQSAVTREVAVFCASTLLYVMAVAWLIVVVWRRAALTAALVARFVALLVLAYLAAKVLGHLVVDARPYLITHVRPLAPVARDNGFPSDHVLLAAALTAGLWRIDRRALVAFAAGTLLVMLGRLGIGAHHTLDVLGSAAIVAAAALVAAAVPLPPAWRTPLLASRAPVRRRDEDVQVRPRN